MNNNIELKTALENKDKLVVYKHPDNTISSLSLKGDVVIFYALDPLSFYEQAIALIEVFLNEPTRYVDYNNLDDIIAKDKSIGGQYFILDSLSINAIESIPELQFAI